MNENVVNTPTVRVAMSATGWKQAGHNLSRYIQEASPTGLRIWPWTDYYVARSIDALLDPAPRTGSSLAFQKRFYALIDVARDLARQYPNAIEINLAVDCLGLARFWVDDVGIDADATSGDKSGST